MDAFILMLLLLITYDQLTQILELFHVVKTVFAGAIWRRVSKSLKYSRQLIFSFD